jgi:hypothetical protein
MCATVWVEHAMGKEPQAYVVESLLVDVRRRAHKNLSNHNLFPPESAKRFSKSASNSFVTSKRNVVQLCDQSQSELRVLRDTKTIETPNVLCSGFYPAVFRPLTLVPINETWEYPSRMRSAN